MNPAPIGRLSYEALEARLQVTTRAHHTPMVGSFELTYRCNFDCVHCYEQGMRDQVELSGDRWCALVDEAAAEGCLYLTLTGGEAIMHPEFERIYERAIRAGLLVTVFSNGSTLTERIATLFRRLPPRSIEVSLYGFSPETYERSTGRARNFELALAGVERMLAIGQRVQIKTVVFDETASDFPAIRDFAARLGQDFRFDTNLHAALDGGRAPLAHRLSPGEIIAVESLDAVAFDEIRDRTATKPSAPSDNIYRCGAGRFAYTVTPDGYLQLCTLVRSLRFDLKVVPFRSAWEALGAETRRRYDSAHRRCSTCTLQSMCGTCPGVAELEAGDPEAAIDHICETTHLRASALAGRPIVPPWKRRRPAKLRVLGQGATHEPERARESAPRGPGQAAV